MDTAPARPLPKFPVPSSTPSADHAAKAGRTAVLAAAERCVNVDRAATHGAAENSFKTLAAIWSARLDVPLSPEQVTIMLIDLKGVRAWGNPGHEDNWIDMAGYAACGGEIASHGKQAA